VGRGSTPQERGAFERLGRAIHRRPKATLALSGAVLVLSLLAAAQGGTLLPFQFPEGTESAQGIEAIQSELPAFADGRFTLVFGSSTLRADEPAFRDAMLRALEPLEQDARVKSIETPYDGQPGADALSRSRDGRHALALVALADPTGVARDYYAELRGLVVSDTLTVVATDDLAVTHDFDAILEKDLQRLETLSLPLVLILLLLVFGTVVAALLPIGVGMLAVIGGVGGVMLLTRFTDVSVYAVNIVTLIGLGVSIDYSLFIVKRYTEERTRGASGEDALGRTLATAGRATAFSGLTVAVGLAGLLFYQGMIFASMGLAATIVVLLAVFYALTFLPALLALLGPRVERLPVRMRRRPKPARESGWARFAHAVMRRPVAALVPALVVLLLAGSPFLQLELGAGGLNALPASAESRAGDALVKEQFPDEGANRISMVVRFPDGDPLSAERVGALYDASHRAGLVPGVAKVQSVVDLDPRLGRADYQALYAQPRSQLPGPVRAAVERSVGPHIVVLSIVTAAAPSSDAARVIVQTVRAHVDVAGAEVLVTGVTPLDIDTLRLVQQRTPWAIAFILAATYLLLLLQTGSIVLPAKAVLMNLLSITATFGAVVWVFQQGHLSDLLGFTPGPIDPSVPILLFCIVFGLSMDYEVLLLSRIHEEYVKHRDNKRAVAEGLARSGALITGAAAIMVVVFGAFVLARVSFIQAIGLGLALAVAADATLVRAVVVPATMRLMGDLNWWAPPSLARWLERFQETPRDASPRASTTSVASAVNAVERGSINRDGLPRARVRKRGP
jgi:uncharacterized membrane protein YdfJ with MMPL/SSD domain